MNSSEAQRLKEDVNRAVVLLDTLTNGTHEHKLPRGAQRMPLREIRAASGLIITHVTKAGVGLSFEHGHGLLVCKLAQQQPTTTTMEASPLFDQTRPNWSAPLFVTLNAASIGFSIGYTHIDSVVILDTDTAVNSFCNTVLELNTDLTAAAGGIVGSHLPATAANLSNYDLSEEEFTYSVADGVMIDVSLTGMSYSVDTDRNKSVYGEFASAQAILSGGLAPPVELHPLYRKLDDILKHVDDDGTTMM